MRSRVHDRRPAVGHQFALVVVAEADDVVGLGGGQGVDLGAGLAVENGQREPVELEFGEPAVEVAVPTERVERGVQSRDFAVVVPEGADIYLSISTKSLRDIET